MRWRGYSRKCVRHSPGAECRPLRHYLTRWRSSYSPPDDVIQRTLDDELAAILENAGYAELPTTVLFRQPVVGFDEQTLLGVPLDVLRATISTHRIMLRGWCDRNEQRRMGLEQGRQQYGDKLPFKVLDIQAQHERAHWSAMEANIAALKRSVALMEQIEDVRRRSRQT